ncbi:class I SAM-dependent methyltransferase [Leucothrix arctica]|uniref:SAM-dependent methyltransferase n=1 Tax=Leucothrix arctica TaxID=1481894 RepID=A0A317C5X5_9GAMM|nr:class I SAM-dependent methyltransferase [Leucothrix arctica]PWQ93611.1 SAM-dependent methyltransferase [Leucothrix arctica]
MDQSTVASYNANQQKIADLHHSLVPLPVYESISEHFKPNSTVLDIGSGTGRDSCWLDENNYKVTGVDASEGMLETAMVSYPDIPFIQDSLPRLNTIESEQSDNVLCAAVLMHLPEAQIGEAVYNLFRITKEGGVILLSFRGTNAEDNREDGKLYTPINPKALITLFEHLGATLLSESQNIEEERGLLWNKLVFRK